MSSADSSYGSKNHFGLNMRPTHPWRSHGYGTSGDGVHLPSLSRGYLLHNRVCPLERAEDGTVTFAVAAELPQDVLDDLALAYGGPVVSTLVSPEELEARIERTLARAAQSIEFESGSQAADDQTADVRDLANQPPVVRYVNLLVRDAYQARASDIHLEAERNRLVARYRIDGVLVPALAPPAGLEAAVVSRIKLLAELDIAERRRPQDGRIRVRLEDRELDLRVSCVPTMFGESVVLRLLDRGGRPVALGELGMPEAILGAVERVARKPHGLFLVTGPTGSGKTTTLYAALGLRDGAGREDHHGRGPGRIRAARDRAGPGAPLGGRDVRDRAPLGAPAGPGRDHDRRAARPGDGGGRGPGRDDGAPRVFDLAHQ